MLQVLKTSSRSSSWHLIVRRFQGELKNNPGLDCWEGSFWRWWGHVAFSASRKLRVFEVQVVPTVWSVCLDPSWPFRPLYHQGAPCERNRGAKWLYWTLCDCLSRKPFLCVYDSKMQFFFHVFAVIWFDEVTRYLDIVVTARCKIVVLKWKQSQIFKALLSPFGSRKRRAQARQDWKKLLHRLPYAYDACAYHHIFPQFARLVALRQIRAGEEITVSPGQTHEPCCHAPFITLIVCSLSSAKVLLIWTWSSRGWLGSKEWPCLAIEQRKLSVLSFVGAGNFCRQTGTFNANVWGDGRS